MRRIEWLYDLKYGIRNLWRYRKVVWSMRDFDYMYILRMLRFQTGLLERSLTYQDMIEAEAKIKEIKRFNELLSNIISDDHDERCGYDSNFEFYTVPIPGDRDLCQLETTATLEQQENNRRAIQSGAQLRKDELKELSKLFRKIEGWWW